MGYEFINQAFDFGRIVSPTRTPDFVEPGFPLRIIQKRKDLVQAEFVVPGLEESKKRSLILDIAAEAGEIQITPFQLKDLGQYATQTLGGLLIETLDGSLKSELAIISRRILHTRQGNRSVEGVQIGTSLVPLSQNTLHLLESTDPKNLKFIARFIESNIVSPTVTANRMDIKIENGLVFMQTFL